MFVDPLSGLEDASADDGSATSHTAPSPLDDGSATAHTAPSPLDAERISGVEASVGLCRPMWKMWN
jgi:hypothetical protein